MAKAVQKPHRLPRQSRSEPQVMSAQHAHPSTPLEEQLDFTNLTDFRRSLLKVIPKLQHNEYLRFVITKHGRPAAVVMSFPAYQLLKRTALRVMDADDAKNRDQLLREAYEELTGKTASPPIVDLSAEYAEGTPKPLGDIVVPTVKPKSRATSDDEERS